MEYLNSVVLKNSIAKFTPGSRLAGSFSRLLVLMLFGLGTHTFGAAISRSANSVFQADEWSEKNGSVGLETGLAPDGTSVGFIASGDWLRYSEIDFGTGALNVFMATIAVDPAGSGTSFEIRLDSPTGQKIGALTTASTGSWGRFQEQYALISAVTGVHDVYLVFPQAPVANINWFTFGTDPNGDTPAQRNERMAWWREARFGEFIHWGAYSQLAGVYGAASGGYGEWIMTDLRIPKADYAAAAAAHFIPAQFDAAAWMRVAKAAGQKYVVVTSKHHEGFSMYDTKVQGFQPYDIKDYAGYGSDPMAALSAEAKRQGIKFCVYYSIMDWHHATQTDTYAGGTTAITDKDLYVSEMKEQLRELIQNYGVESIWFDGEWSNWWTTADGQALYRYLRTLKHSLIVNNRVGKRGADDGDYGTPEQEIPPSGLGYDWESCMTINGTWGYKTSDVNWKSTQELLRNLVDIASKGGNYLLNIGPTGAGVIPQPSIDRLSQMGAWLTINGESIYGTTPTSIGAPSWGRSTTKADKLYLHVFDWPATGQLVVNSVPGVVSRCALLSAPSVALPFSLVNGALTITIPTAAPDSNDSVLVVDTQMPWLHSPQAIPGKIEAEYYKEGGEGVGYHDTTPLNSGGMCRTGNVDIEAKPNGVLCVGYVDPGEWLAYDVAVAHNGIYDLQVRLASGANGKTFHIELDGANITGPIAIPNTGAWENFTTITLAGLQLQAKTGVLKIVFDDGGINLDWVNFIDRTPNSAPTISVIADQTLTAGVPSAPIPFTIGDAETPASNLTLVASSDTPGLVPPAAIVFGGSGASRTVTVTPAAGQSGTATIGIQVSDANNASSSIHFKVAVNAPVRGVILDRNNDGISDVWAALYPNIGAPTADPDGDGVTNVAEAQAGTDPTNPSSRFIATAARDASGSLVVRWPSVAGKYYFVETSNDLLAWTPLAGEYTGTGAELSAIVRPAGTNTGTRIFWHVVVFDVDSTGSGLNDWEKSHLDKVATITATAGANGSINPNGSLYVAKGSSLTYTITPAAGYRIGQVLVDGLDAGNTASYTFTNIQSPHTITANFGPLYYTLLTSAANGSVELSPTGGSYNSGTVVTLTAIPASGYTFSSWSGDLSGNGNPQTIAITGNKTVTATFAYNTNSSGPFYVSPSGSDNNGGTINSPFKTLLKARDAIRSVNSNMSADIYVYLRAGTHTLDSTLTLTSSDKGTNGHRIYYKAYPGETPVISGGVSVANWSLHDASKNIYRANIGTSFDSRHLYVDGVRAIRARGNNFPGGFTVSSTNITLPGAGVYANMGSWVNIRDIEMVGYQDNCWKYPRCPIASISGNTLNMASPCYQKIFANPGWAMNQVAWVENAYELLDAAGEFYINRTDGCIYYKPRPGESMSTSRFIIPKLEALVNLTGTATDKISNITFDGLTFAYTTWLRPNSTQGYPVAQAGIMDGDVKTPGSFSGSNAQYIDVLNCTFNKLGNVGVNFDQGSKNCKVASSCFTDISSEAVMVGDFGFADHHQSDRNLVSANDTIYNNYIDACGIEYKGNPGITVGYVDGIDIEYNTLTNLPYSGISVGWGWGVSDDSYTPVARNNKISHNYISNYMQVLKDGGGIYTLGQQDNSTMDNNYIEGQNNVFAYYYLDNGTAGYYVGHNVCLQRGGSGASWAVLLNNDCGTGQAYYSTHNNSVDALFYDSGFTVENRGFSNGVNNNYATDPNNLYSDAQSIISNAGSSMNKIRIEAENGSVYGNTRVGTDAACSNGGGVNTMTSDGSGVSFSIPANASGFYLRYANAGSAGTMSLYQGSYFITKIGIMSTGGGSTYQTLKFDFPLASGSTLKIQRDGGDTPINIDYVDLIKDPITTTGAVTFEAENGILKGNAAIAPDASASNGNAVGWIYAAGDGVVFTGVPVTNGFNVTYANAGGDSYLNVYVNGTYKTSFTVHGTGGWHGYRTDWVNLLIPPNAILELRLDSSTAGVQIDKVVINR